MRYYSTYNFVGSRIDGYDQPCALLTKQAAQALNTVSDAVMEHGYRLKIFDAYRPQMAVDHFLRWAEDTNDVKMKTYFYPNLDKALLLPRGYIDAHSSHSRGSAIDLTLFDMASGKEVDMGSPFDFFGEQSHSDYIGNLTQSQSSNRTFLRNIMIQHGFLPLDNEWWHFMLKNEPYPNTFFTFPVSVDSIKSGQ